ncbi:phosphoglycerate kinase [Fidelibacter multiformis]|jgi:phosphoglycerate kinase|uniref:phosphoglycerate kinase n=1 Tax=Fidelibacter multiformis TaxID=3377529 RepID=UPI0037DD0858
MARLTVNDVNFKDQKVLVRVDFNVPVNDAGEITNDYRIVSSLPTLQKILKDGGSVICMSHLGRPKGEADPAFSLKPVQKRLSELLDREVKFAEDCVGEEAEKLAASLKPGDVLLLENLRFHKEEKKNDPEFAKKLASYADMYVNDAFGTSHRAHASTVGVTEYFDKVVCGLLLEKELVYLKDKVEDPARPYTAILGGAKISGKIDTIQHLLKKVDHLLVGGGMIFTFYKAMGYEIGNSLVEEDKVDLAKEILEEVKSSGVNFHLPVDVVAADAFENDAPAVTVPADQIPAGKLGLDIGPETVNLFSDIISKSKTVLWNGPMGVFEMPKFAKGTEAIAKALAEATDKGTISLVGGGDSVAAVNKLGYSDKISHVSTGGGASLELISGLELPAVAKISEKE